MKSFNDCSGSLGDSDLNKMAVGAEDFNEASSVASRVERSDLMNVSLLIWWF